MLFLLFPAGFLEITQFSFLQRPILELDSYFGWPAGLGLDHVFHYPGFVRNPVNHYLAEVTTASC